MEQFSFSLPHVLRVAGSETVEPAHPGYLCYKSLSYPQIYDTLSARALDRQMPGGLAPHVRLVLVAEVQALVDGQRKNDLRGRIDHMSYEA